jgi:hypothetical protein
MRVLGLPVSVSVVCLVSSMSDSQLDVDAPRPQIEALVEDEATPAFEVPEKAREIGLTGNLTWPDEGTVGLALSASGRASEGYVVIDRASQQLVGFVAAQPQGRVPEDEISADQAVQIAQDFAGRHHHELVAEGGEISTSLDETITPLGARTVHLRRIVQGVRAPTFADVGVRVYDGKVVYFRRKHVPLADDLNLPGTVTAERAQEVAAANVPGNTLEALLWFDTIHEVIEVRGQQRNVWSVWAEVKTKNSGNPTRLGMFLHCQLEANTGEVVQRELLQPTRGLHLRYTAAGGEHVPRDGYPAWIHRPVGLFVVKADGSDLRCLAAGTAIGAGE